MHWSCLAEIILIGNKNKPFSKGRGFNCLYNWCYISSLCKYSHFFLKFTWSEKSASERASSASSSSSLSEDARSGIGSSFLGFFAFLLCFDFLKDADLLEKALCLLELRDLLAWTTEVLKPSSLSESSWWGFWEAFVYLLLELLSLWPLDFFGVGGSIWVWVEKFISVGELLNRFLLGRISSQGPCPYIW